MKHARNDDNCNSFRILSVADEGVYNNVVNHVRAFSTWRTQTGSNNISPSAALSRTVLTVKIYFIASAHDKSDGM